MRQTQDGLTNLGKPENQKHPPALRVPHSSVQPPSEQVQSTLIVAVGAARPLIVRLW